MQPAFAMRGIRISDVVGGVFPQAGQIGVEIVAGARGGVKIAVAVDGAGTGIEAVDLAEQADELGGRFQLRIAGIFYVEVAGQAYADRVFIVAVCMRADIFERTARFDQPVLADEEMVADAGPAVLPVNPMHVGGR